MCLIDQVFVMLMPATQTTRPLFQDSIGMNLDLWKYFCADIMHKLQVHDEHLHA